MENGMSKTKFKYVFVTYVIILTNLVIFLLQFFSGDNSLDPEVALKWGANFAPFTLDTDWWRLVSCMFVHNGLFHFLMNMFGLYQIGRAIEKEIGSLNLFLIYIISGVFASLASAYWNLFTFSVGASGAIFGLFGFEVASEIIKSAKDHKRVRFVLINFFLYLSVVLFLGTQFPFDNAGHLGGLIMGIILAVCFKVVKTRSVAWSSAAVLLISLPILFLGFKWIPRYQKKYYDIGQKMLITERRANQISGGDYTSDAIFIKDLKSVMPSWDSIVWSLDSLKNIPEELSEDKLKFQQYVQARSLEMQYIITYIEQESYIYFDSLEVVRGQMRDMDSVKYIFDFNSIQEEVDQVDTTDTNTSVGKEYYDSSWRATEAWNAKYYRLGYKDSLNRWHGLVRDYFLNTKVQMKGEYKEDLRDGVFRYYTENNTYDAAGVYRKNFKVGKWQYFHKNGQMSQEVRYQDKAYLVNAWSKDGIQLVKEGNGEIKEYYENGILSKYEVYKEGLQDSISYGYHADGTPYYKELYEKGDLIQGVSYSINNETFNYDVSTYIPQPEGGMKRFRQYEQRAKSNRKTLLTGQVGQVEMVFSLTGDGELYDIKVLRGVNPQLDAIAQRILLEGPKWIPGKLHGQEPIAVEGYVVINFP